MYTIGADRGGGGGGGRGGVEAYAPFTGVGPGGGGKGAPPRIKIIIKPLSFCNLSNQQPYDIHF